MKLEDEALANLALVTASVKLSDGPDELSRSDLEEWKRGLERAFGYLQMQSQIGGLLSDSYGKALKNAESDE
jgi:hypothetical protein